MKIKYIEPFLEATSVVFKDFFKAEPEHQNPYLIKREDEHNWELSAIIGIAGEAKGVVVLSFPEKLAMELTSKLVGQEVTSIDDDVIDTIGEVVNIIAGNAKKGFEHVRLVISLPAIITGKNHSISWPGSTIPIIGIPYKIFSGDFILSVGLENVIGY